MTMLAPASARERTTALPMPLLPPVTMATLSLRFLSTVMPLLLRARSTDPLEQVVADAERIGDDRQRRVHGADRREEARVDDVEVVEFVGLAIHVEYRRRRVGAEADRAGLMRGGGDVHCFVEPDLAFVHALVHAELAE